MESINNAVITIDEISQEAKKIVVKSGRDKYSFWLTKKDGADTRAYATWKDMRPNVGDQIDIQFKEEDAEFTNQEGKLINFTRRTILNLRPADGKTVSNVSSTAPRSYNGSPSNGPTIEYVTKESYEEKIKDMSVAFLKMATEIARIKNHLNIKDE